MKKRVLIFCLHLPLVFVQAQWQLKTPLKETSTVKSMYCTIDGGIIMLDSSVSQNALLISADNGANWTRKAVNAIDLFMLNDDTGFLVSNTSLTRTNNRFETITGNSLGFSGFNEVFFIDENIGFCCGSNGKIIKTTDAGLTWNLTPTNITDLVEDIYFIDNQIGFACTGNGKVLKTTNQGSSWSIVNNTTTNSLTRIFFLNSSLGFIGGDSILKKTTDGGETWTTINFPGVSNDIKFWNNQLIIPSILGDIYASSDEGNTWQSIASPNPTTTYHSAIVQNNNSLLVAGVGRLYNTINGATWTVPLDGIYRSRLNSISFADANRGVVVGDGNYSSVVYRTDNGGNTWIREQLQLGQNNKFQYAHLNSVGRGLLIGEQATPVWITTNYGDTWSPGPSNIPGGFFTSCWMKLNQSFLIGTFNQLGADGLLSWSAGSGWTQDINTLGLITAIDFANDNLGVIGGFSGRIFTTDDGGLTWTNIGLPGSDFPGGVPNIKILQRVNENLIYADDYRSVDGGLTWQLHNFSNSSIRSYRFFNSQYGYGITALKTVHKTLDGGLTWIPLNTDSLNFSEFDFNAIHFGLDKVIGVHNNSDIYVLAVENTLNSNDFDSAATPQVAFYPNPVIDRLYFETAIDVESVKLYDLQMREIPVEITQNSIRLVNIPSGVYIVKLATKRGIFTKKIVKQ